MKNGTKIERVWTFSLIILGTISFVIGIVDIVGAELPHSVRLTIAVVQIIVGVVFMTATVLKLKRRKTGGEEEK